MFRVGINGADLEGKGTGVKRYLSSILPYLSTKDRMYYIYSRAPLPEELLPDKKNFIARHSDKNPDSSYTLWEQLLLPGRLKEDRIDIFFSAGNSIPLRLKMPSIVVIHDLSFEAHPEWFGFRERWRRRIITRLSAKKAQKVITDSDFSRSEIIDRYKIRSDKIILAPNAASTLFKKKIRESAGERVESPVLNKPVILYVGLLLERRFIRELIEAFSLVKKKYKSASLILVGINQLKSHKNISELAADYSVSGSVTHYEYLDDERLVRLYRYADVFVYLSQYEGFGIPPLEAMTAGIPVVTSDLTALGEIFRESALLVHNHTPQGIAAKIEYILSDAGIRNSLKKRGNELAGSYSWEKTAGIIDREIARLCCL